MQHNAEQRLQELGLRLPEIMAPRGSFLPYVVSGSMIYLSGKGAPLRDGTGPVHKVGAEVSVEEARP
jgi:hypothetical protein